MRALRHQPHVAAIGELERVGEEVGEDLPHAQGVAEHVTAPGFEQAAVDVDAEHELAAMRERGVGVAQRAQQLGQIESGGLQRELAGFDLRQVEHVGDDGRQGLRVVDDLVEVVLAFGRLDIAFARQLRQAQHAVERRAQLVAGVGEESALRAVGCFGLVARSRQGLRRLAPLGDVVDDPDRAAHRGMRRVHRFGQQPRKEAAAVLALRLMFELDELALSQPRRGRAAELGIGLLIGPDHAARLTRQ